MKDLNSYIEHTILKADTSKEEIIKLCEEAKEYNFCGVCVPPYYVRIANDELEKSAVKVVTVVGFPLGYSTTPAKVEETRKAIDAGADEIDMVINIAALKEKNINHVKNDIESVCMLTQLKGAKLKVIIETALLTDEEKIMACKICAEVGVDFVKTSTGFAKSGAKIEDIRLMRENLPESILIKASGGIKTPSQAASLIQVGAERLGTSSGVKLVSSL
ncbi:MAG: deoxyribose-phosphate aldolase [Chitinophagales bacterium]